MQINHREIGLDAPPFIIAEMSGNHNQSIKRAFEIVDEASRAGVNGIKLQTYTAETITIDSGKEDFVVTEPSSPWVGYRLYDLYQLAHTPWEWHEPIFERAKNLGLEILSSPFDETAVDFLDKLGVSALKIASFEITHLPLIRHAAKTGRPLILSTGMATVSEINEAVLTARDAGCKALCLLKCTSTYPASPTASNLATIPKMRDLFDCEVGLSDHTPGIGVAVAAASHGATMIEKHFTISRKDGGVDSQFSLEPSEMKALVIETKRAWQSFGDIQFGPTESEHQSMIFRRSIYFSKDLKKGDIVTKTNIRCVRPGYGLEPKYYDSILGKRVNTNVSKGDPVFLSQFDEI